MLALAASTPASADPTLLGVALGALVAFPIVATGLWLRRVILAEEDAARLREARRAEQRALPAPPALELLEGGRSDGGGRGEGDGRSGSAKLRERDPAPAHVDRRLAQDGAVDSGGA